MPYWTVQDKPQGGVVMTLNLLHQCRWWYCYEKGGACFFNALVLVGHD